MHLARITNRAHDAFFVIDKTSLHIQPTSLMAVDHDQVWHNTIVLRMFCEPTRECFVVCLSDVTYWLISNIAAIGTLFLMLCDGDFTFLPKTTHTKLLCLGRCGVYFHYLLFFVLFLCSVKWHVFVALLYSQKHTTPYSGPGKRKIWNN